MKGREIKLNDLLNEDEARLIGIALEEYQNLLKNALDDGDDETVEQDTRDLATIKNLIARLS